MVRFNSIASFTRFQRSGHAASPADGSSKSSRSSTIAERSACARTLRPQRARYRVLPNLQYVGETRHKRLFAQKVGKAGLELGWLHRGGQAYIAPSWRQTGLRYAPLLREFQEFDDRLHGRSKMLVIEPLRRAPKCRCQAAYTVRTENRSHPRLHHRSILSSRKICRKRQDKS